MHSNDDRGRSTGGLTTDDLAQPSGTTAAGPEETKGVSPGPGTPVYPGESTTTHQTRSAAGATDLSGLDRPAAEGPDAGAGTADARDASTASKTSDTPETSDTSDTSARSADSDEEAPQLLTGAEDEGFRDRWQKIQTNFVDDPREAVHDADALVADVMQTLATTFAHHKKDLEDQWGQGEKVDTEELRRALRRYRSFFNRLLST
ncbi:hypothetical protein ACF073_28915 [Streptomyces sp. NPDC015171]|uniref:hypothetical protein n=1 Tax=Streptomyces sp. NPDC015171 TaxID=3364945 RepID=UPI0036FD23E4